MSIFSIGYIYQFILNIFKSDNDIKLPEVSFSQFKTFFKFLPIGLIWGIYYFTIFLMIYKMFASNSFLFYTLFFIWIFFYPFVQIIHILYLKNYRKNADLFAPSYFVTIVKKTFSDVFRLNIEIYIFLIIVAFIIFRLLINSDYLALMRPLQISVRLFGVCMTVYAFNIAQYLYAQGLVKVVCDRFLED